MQGKPRYEVCVTMGFSAAHSLRGYSGDCETLHGHNWSVEVAVACEKLDELGIGVDFREVKRVLAEVIGKFDHANLNELSEFSTTNPSSENIARIIFRQMSEKLNREDRKVARVRVGETETAFVDYREE